MKLLHVTKVGLLIMLGSPGGVLAQPFIQSLSPEGQLVWSNDIPGNVSVIEKATNLTSGAWEPIFYDWATNGLYATPLPASDVGQAFYRVAVATNIADTNLVLHLSFDNEFPQGVVLDVSGYGNHGLRYGRPCCPTNWPAVSAGPDGSQAAEFNWYPDGYGTYGKTGDYIGIPHSPQFTNLPQASICLWVRYDTALNGDINNDHNSTPLDSGRATGSWRLGRAYTSYTTFYVYTNNWSSERFVSFPDVAPMGDSGGWHFYAVTFDGGLLKAYFDGTPFVTNSVPVAALSMGGSYMGMSCWTFNATPELDLSVDLHPNNAWMNGAIDDVRIYSRNLSDSEVSELYHSFNTFPPTVPANVRAESPSTSQIDLRWDPSTDLFGVAGYLIRRDGVVVGDQLSLRFIDGGLSADTAYEYTVQAYDVDGIMSAQTSGMVAITCPAGSPIDFIVDNEDGEPWVDMEGAWRVGGGSGWLLGFYGDSYLLDYKDVKGWSLTFRPELPETGVYSVYMRYPGLSGQTWQMSTAVPVEVVHAGQTNSFTVNQRLNYGTWFLLGGYEFDAGTNGEVRVCTDGTDGSFVLGDAIRFVK